MHPQQSKSFQSPALVLVKEAFLKGLPHSSVSRSLCPDGLWGRSLICDDRSRGSPSCCLLTINSAGVRPMASHTTFGTVIHGVGASPREVSQLSAIPTGWLGNH